MTSDKPWLLKAFPVASFIPKRHAIVEHIPSGNRALILTDPTDPEELEDFDLSSTDIATRPCTCTILLGEDIIYDVDVSQLCPVVDEDEDD